MLSRRTVLILAAGAPFAAFFATRAPAQAGTKTAAIYANNAIAVDGSDVVAYFAKGGPVQGSAALSFEWNGAMWLFSNAVNRDAFAASPEVFVPQYGGYCAWAVSQGYIAPTTPKAFSIVDGKLYLNFSRSIQRRWERDISALIKAADANWPAVLG